MYSLATRLYLRSPTRIVRLERAVEFVYPPRVDECVTLRSAAQAKQRAIRVREVTHVEGTGVDLMLESADIPDDELDGFVTSYQAEGWHLASTTQRHPVST